MKRSIDPNTNDPFPYLDYVQVRQNLLTALKGPRFYASLTGNSGMGKTCLIRELSATLDKHRHTLIYFSSARASLVGVARFLAQTLHVTPRRSYLETMHVLIQAISAQNSHLLLWIDEADQLDVSMLQEVRMLAESSPSVEQLFSLVLSGLPPLLSQLDLPTLFPLKRRISNRWSLNGLHRNEIDAFLEFRFGSNAKRFTPPAKEELFERAQATPALIDSVGRDVLAKQSGDIDPESLRLVLDSAGL